MPGVAPPQPSSHSLRVRRTNRSLRRSFTKGRLEKVHALLSTALSSEWHPLGRQVIDLASELRGRLRDDVQPEGGPADFEPLVASLKASLRSFADALPAFFEIPTHADTSDVAWFAAVCDAVFNTGDTFLALFDSYTAVYCRLDSRLLDIYQQMANLQMAHLGIASSLWRFDCTKAVDLMRGLRVRVCW